MIITILSLIFCLLTAILAFGFSLRIYLKQKNAEKLNPSMESFTLKEILKSDGKMLENNQKPIEIPAELKEKFEKVSTAIYQDSKENAQQLDQHMVYISAAGLGLIFLALDPEANPIELSLLVIAFIYFVKNIIATISSFFLMSLSLVCSERTVNLSKYVLNIKEKLESAKDKTDFNKRLA